MEPTVSCSELNILFAQLSFHKVKQKKPPVSQNRLAAFQIFIKCAAQSYHSLRDMSALFSTCKAISSCDTSYYGSFTQSRIPRLLSDLGMDLFFISRRIQKALSTQFHQVESLDFASYSLQEQHLSKLLEYFPNATELNFQEADLKSEHIHIVAKFPKLQKLDVSFCSKVYAKSLFPLTECPNVTELNLQDCRWMGLEDTHVQCFKNVRVLNLEGTDSTDATIDAIMKHLAHLEELNINRCNKVTTNAVASLFTHRTLRVLKMNDCTRVNLTVLKASFEFLNARVLKTLHIQKQIFHFQNVER